MLEKLEPIQDSQHPAQQSGAALDEYRLRQHDGGNSKIANAQLPAGFAAASDLLQFDGKSPKHRQDAPAFAKPEETPPLGKFVQTKLTESQEKSLAVFPISRERAEKVLAEINDHGVDVRKAMSELMRTNGVLGMGETHEPNNPQRELGTAAMGDLRKAGATHMAIEAPASIQPALDQYLKTGKLDPNFLPPLLRHDDYLKLLESARKNGIKIVAVDEPKSKYDEGGDGAIPSRRAESGADRDRVMAEGVQKILDQDPNNKVIYWVGSKHLAKSPTPNAAHQDGADLLKQHNSVATVLPIYDKGMGIYPLSEITEHTVSPAAVATKQTPTLGALPYSRFNDREHMRDYDYIFVFPRRKF